MLDSEVINVLKSACDSLPKVTLETKGDGWVNLVGFAPVVKQSGINYKDFGFEKFGDFIAGSGAFSIWTDYSVAPPVKYAKIKERRPRTLPASQISQHKTSNKASFSRVDPEEVDRIKRRLRLENNLFIGQFAPSQNEGWYMISDIRNTDFTKIEDKERGVKNLSISFKSPNKDFNKFAYYKFTWVLLETAPLKFGIDLREEVVPVWPKDIVNSLYEGIMRYPAGAAKKIARSLDTLKKQLTQSGKEVFIYELLQNANDYPRKQRIEQKSVPVPVEVEFHITDKYLTFQHTGEYFNPKNIAAICDINDGEKSDNTEAIGYKGIGFKTVFLDNDYVYLNTGNYSFRFDKTATDVINTPWQILPIWTERNEIDYNIVKVFKQHSNEDFRVKFALQPRDNSILTDQSREDNYIDLFSKVFDSERVILFIPNIKKVSIFVDGQDEPIIREKDNNNWCVSAPLVDEIPEAITEKINDVLSNPDSLRSDGYEKIPEKYLNFRKTAVKFACKRDGRTLLPVDNSILYCYLPAKRADWGFNFLMNTDMVPNGQRDDIEDIELNHEIAKIAGRQFFYWIKQLIESREYEFESIFSLIPDFEKCKERRAYKVFIEEFENEFKTLIKEEPFVPTVDKDGQSSFKCIDEIINDMTGLTANGVMSDNDFLSLMEIKDGFLPELELRQSASFMAFLYKHSPSEFDIDIEDVVEKCEQDEFQKWLSYFDNNTLFIEHWLKEENLSSFAKKSIFIEYKGGLFSADNLYYDFEANCCGLEFLREYIAHLSPVSRQRLETLENWTSFADQYFNVFDATKMIERYILPAEGAMELLQNLDNSVAFYHYLANHNVDLKDNSTKIPYLTENLEHSTDYKCYRYLYSKDAADLTEESWLGENTIQVLSHCYYQNVGEELSTSLTSLFSRLGFKLFDKASFISSVLIGDAAFKDKVNVAIDKDFKANKGFIDYVFNCDAQYKELSFKDYVLRCIDINGADQYLSNDDVRYFDQDAYAQNSTFKENVNHDWLTDSMMYALSNAYFDDLEKEQSKKLESFLRQQFGVKTFTDKSFFLDVVLKNRTTIYESLTYETKIKTFLAYLKRDAERIFDDTMSFNNIKDMPLLCHDGTIVKTRDANIQYFEYDEDAITLVNKTWCPSLFVILDKIYTDDFSQDVRQLFKITTYDINSVLGLILKNDSLKQSIKVSTNNYDFWRWVKANQKLITDFKDFSSIQLLDKNGILTPATSLYISDIYQQDEIETLVTRYVKTAQFVSSSYFESSIENEKADWMKLFKKLGLKSDNKDILFSDILPNLSSFEEDSVVAMMTKHVKDLKEKWAEKRNQIIQLKVRTQSGSYKPVNQTIIVNIEEESIVEPFKYITLSDEVHPDILKNNKELLLLIYAEYANSNLITTKQGWIEAKIKDYIAKFNTDINSIADIHLQFVRELAKIDTDYTIDDKLKKQIKYRTRNTEVTYKYANELTLGTAYSPICDFEANGITELPFISDNYIFEGNKDSIKNYFKGEGLHQNMTKEDLKFLSNRAFACYFWSYCFSRRVAEYETWIEEGLFNKLVCIPTLDSVRAPETLYSPIITAGYAVRAKVPQWEEKVPYKGVVDKIENRTARELFDKLSFCNNLSFSDCLYYLANVNDKREDESEHRRKIIDWILQSPNRDASLVEAYRNDQNSTWRNGKGQKKQIKELYAIHPDATQQKNIFWGDEFVMQTNAFPYNTDLFEEICDILKIKYLVAKDFVTTPVNNVDETASIVATLRPRILVLAAIEDSDKFQHLYEKFNEKLSQYHYNVCEKIDLGYDTIHNDVTRIYNDDKNVYYVASWLHNRTFTKFCSCIKRLIGCNVDNDVFEDIFDENNSIESSIAKYCSSLTYNTQFQSYLKALDLTINAAIDDDEEQLTDPEDYYSDVANANNVDSEDALQQNVDNASDSDAGLNTYKLPIDDERGKSVLEDSKAEYGYDTSSSIKENKEEFADVTTDNGASEENNNSVVTASDITKDSVKTKNINDVDKVPASVVETKDDTYTQVDDNDESNVDVEDPAENESGGHDVTESDKQKHSEYHPDNGRTMGSVTKDKDYQPLGEKASNPRTRKHPKPYTKEEVNRLRSQGTPLELESLPPTKEEIDLLAQCNISPEQIADTNYLAQLRLYLNLTRDHHEEPAESMEEFVRNADDVTSHKMKDGRYIHTCSAARGVMYISPSVWSKMVDDKWKICVYLNGQGKNFHYINNAEEFLKLVVKDDVVIKITGKEKTDVVEALYSGLLKNVKGTAYTLIRVATRTNMDAVFAHYVGAMAEAEDGNDDMSDYE